METFRAGNGRFWAGRETPGGGWEATTRREQRSVLTWIRVRYTLFAVCVIGSISGVSVRRGARFWR